MEKNSFWEGCKLSLIWLGERKEYGEKASKRFDDATVNSYYKYLHRFNSDQIKYIIELFLADAEKKMPSPLEMLNRFMEKINFNEMAAELNNQIVKNLSVDTPLMEYVTGAIEYNTDPRPVKQQIASMSIGMLEQIVRKYYQGIPYKNDIKTTGSIDVEVIPKQHKWSGRNLKDEYKQMKRDEDKKKEKETTDISDRNSDHDMQ